MRNRIDGPLVSALAMILENKHIVHEGELYISKTNEQYLETDIYYMKVNYIYLRETSTTCIINTDDASFNLSLTSERNQTNSKNQVLVDFQIITAFPTASSTP